MSLPATGYLENAARTVAEMKTALEAQRDFISNLLGGGARTELTIASGAVTPGARDHGGHFTLDTEGDAATDDLDVITYTNLPAGSIIRVYGENAARVVTLKHANGGAGEMLMTDSADFVLDALDQWVEFQRRSTSWVEIARSYGVDHAGLRAYHEIPRQVGGRKLAPAEGLVLTRPSASTVDVDADNVLLRDASGNQKLFASLNVTIDITASGAAGLDTGSEASGTWYHVWAIGKADGTLSAMLSTATAIGSLTFPSGYTYAGYVGAVYNDGSSNLLAFRQLGEEVAVANLEVLTDGSQTTATSVDLAAIVPTTAALAKVEIAIRSASGTSSALSGSLFADSAGAIRCARVQARGGNTTTTFSRFMAETLLSTAQTTWYAVDSGVTGRMSLTVTGWRF